MALFVSRAARQRASPLAGTEGKVPLADGAAARALAGALARRGGEHPTAGQLLAVSRLEEALGRLLRRHLVESDPAVLERIGSALEEGLGAVESGRLLDSFAADFALAVAGRERLAELVVWGVLAANPAAAAVAGALFAGSFAGDPRRGRLFELVEEGALPRAAAPRGPSLLERLRAPIEASPDSLAGQLRFLLERGGEEGEPALELARGIDLLAEEERPWLPPGPGPVEIPAFADLEAEPERYSPDKSWMPGVVMMAKNVYVWLDQLERRRGRPVRRLDEIPEEALAELAARGFTVLWLIGVWERSAASRRLKRLCGFADAEASAYSLSAYRIAAEIGGEEALAALTRRAAAHGLRLAADMVPNHMGIDSDWVLDHPERFLSLEGSPFPAYRFTGPDLSPRRDVAIYVEDHYYDRSDAAVVFQRVDRATGRTRYVYHGNDGTRTPWNDTAQLDFLNPQTREAVIATVIEVARRFPVIRFDAAMTLARRHVQRLWHPPPGSGGAIPSRAERALAPERFDELMPEEFFRQVVDRVAAEAPDTLLLAEAFWLMEGYFVRSLGMHRVYNSAFMNLLRDGDNAKLRALIRETLEFDPAILERYVNFLTNPDEEPARAQLGTGDRYFGACVLLATLPGLPMFGHGQIEGHGEKYGMEYRRARLDEPDDRELVARHEREVVPLLRRRAAYARAEDFELFDFVSPLGGAHEDVIAFAAGSGADRLLIVFNNAYETARGRVARSCPRRGRAGRSLGEVFNLGSSGHGLFWEVHERVGDAVLLRPAADLVRRGLDLELPPFGYRIFDRWRRLEDGDAGRLARLERHLAGASAPSLALALEDLELEPAAAALARLLEAPLAVPGAEPGPAAERVAELAARVLAELPAWAAPAGEGGSAGLPPLVAERQARLAGLPGAGVFPDSERMRAAAARLFDGLLATPTAAAALARIDLLTHLFAASPRRAELFRRLRAAEPLTRALRAAGGGRGEVARIVAVTDLALAERWCEGPTAPGRRELVAMLSDWSAKGEARALAALHRAAGETWVRQEDFEGLLDWRLATGLVAALAGTAEAQGEAEAASAWLDAIERLRELARREGYRFERLQALLGDDRPVAHAPQP